MKSIKAVIFDVGRVILPVDWQRVTRSLGLSEAQAEELRVRVIEGDHYDKYERGHIDTAQFFAGFPDEYDIHHPPEHLVNSWNAMIAEPFEGIEEILSHLKQRVELYTLSNTSKAHSDLFTSFSAFDHFHEIHTSHSLGSRKPEDEIYHSLLAAIEHPPEQTLFVDDLDENLETARKLGMNAEKSVNSVDMTRAILKKYGLID